MKNNTASGFAANAHGALRLCLFSFFVLGGLYPSVLWVFGRVAVPFSAEGSLLRNQEGAVIGSRLIAQKFAGLEYFWPRPSAVDYNAAAAGGSNLPPSSPELRNRVAERIEALGGSAIHPVPVALLAASASGLDPHLPIEAVFFQAARVAFARGLKSTVLRVWVEEWTLSRKLRRHDSPVNILELNIALDERYGPPRTAASVPNQEVIE